MRKVNRHTADYRACRTRMELIKLQGILLRDARPPRLRGRGVDTRLVRGDERRAVGREAVNRGGGEAEEGEKEQALVL